MGGQPKECGISHYVAVISHLFDGPSGATVHLIWFGRASDTVLGETEDDRELFQLLDCQDGPLESIVKKCDVCFKPCTEKEEWRRLGRQKLAFQY